MVNKSKEFCLYNTFRIFQNTCNGNTVACHTWRSMGCRLWVWSVVYGLPQLLYSVLQVSRAGTSNYIPQYLCDVITCPCPWYLLRSSIYDCIIKALDCVFSEMLRIKNNWYDAEDIFLWELLSLRLEYSMWHSCYCWQNYPGALSFLLITLDMQGPSYLGLTRSISWLLMPWLLTSTGHQQPWYWLCRIGRFLSYLRKDFNYLRHISVEKWHKM